MLDEDDLWWAEDVPTDDVEDLRDTMPEMRHYLVHERREEDTGFRAILERPDACRRAWWRPSRGRPLHAA